MGLFDKFAPTAALYAELESGGANPFNVTFDAVLSPTEARIGDRTVLLLGTNNYLGLTCDPAVIAKAIEGVERFGTGTTGSRIASGSYDGHRELEHALADFYGRRHAMIFSTGYQANAGIL